MIYLLDEPLYSTYILPIVNMINKYFVNEGVMLSIDHNRSHKSKFYVLVDLLLDNWKTRIRVLSLTITDKPEITYAYILANPSLVSNMVKEIKQIAPQAKIGFAYAWYKNGKVV